MICTPTTFIGDNNRLYHVCHPLQNPFCELGTIFTGTGTWRIEYHAGGWGWREVRNYDARDRLVAQYIDWSDCEEWA